MLRTLAGSVAARFVQSQLWSSSRNVLGKKENGYVGIHNSLFRNLLLESELLPTFQYSGLSTHLEDFLLSMRMSMMESIETRSRTICGRLVKAKEVPRHMNPLDLVIALLHL